MKKNLIYGVHPVLEALGSGTSIEKILVRKGNRNESVEHHARKREIPLQYVPDATLQRLCPNGNHQGVLAFISAITYQSLEDVILAIQDRGEYPLLVMLDGVTDVRNFGAIARTAECMGAHGLVVPIQGSAPANADAVKTSAGALLHLSVCREANLVDALNMMHAYGIQTICCTEKAADSLYELDLDVPCCLIFGSEERGISKSVLKRVNKLVKVPLKGKVNSLNVSVAVAMAMGEAGRQRG